MGYMLKTDGDGTDVALNRTATPFRGASPLPVVDLKAFIEGLETGRIWEWFGFDGRRSKRWWWLDTVRALPLAQKKTKIKKSSKVYHVTSLMKEDGILRTPI